MLGHEDLLTLAEPDALMQLAGDENSTHQRGGVVMVVMFRPGFS